MNYYVKFTSEYYMFVHITSASRKHVSIRVQYGMVFLRNDENQQNNVRIIKGRRKKTLIFRDKMSQHITSSPSSSIVLGGSVILFLFLIAYHDEYNIRTESVSQSVTRSAKGELKS